MSILEALEDWNPWWKTGIVEDLMKGIKREALEDVLSLVDLHKIKVITGVRRSGKSTILYQIIDNLLSHVPPNSIVLMNFDDARLSTVEFSDILKAYIEHMKPEFMYLFLDEVHNAKNWVSSIRRLTDTRKANIFITDSCSYFIPIDYAKILTGRKISIELFPLSFREYLKFKNVKVEMHGTEERAKLRGYLRDYILNGGFPEIALTNWDKGKRILIEYFGDIITKDITSRYDVNYQKIRDLAYYLISNIGQRVTLRKLRNIFGLGIETAQKYIHYLETVYLIFAVKNFSEKVKEQIIMPKKIYAIDTGMVNAVGFKISENFGPALENVVYLELRRRGYDVYYLKIDNKEVDFIARKGIKTEKIINVCYDPTEEKTRKREIEGMLKALKTLRERKGLILTWEHKEKIRIGEKEIIFTPIYEWLLGSKFALD